MPIKPYVITKDGAVDLKAVARELHKNGAELQRLGKLFRERVAVPLQEQAELLKKVTGEVNDN